MARRLDLRGAGRLRGLRRHLREFERDAARLPAWLLSQPQGPHDIHARLVAFEAMTDRPGARRGVRRRVVETWIRTLLALKAADPSARAVATIELPRLFGSDLEVFRDDARHARFVADLTEGCTGGSVTMTPLPPSRSLRREWALRLPADLPERGVAFVHDAGTPDEVRGERWCYGDVLPG